MLLDREEGLFVVESQLLHGLIHIDLAADDIVAVQHGKHALPDQAILPLRLRSPYSKTTLPCTATSKAVVCWVLSQPRRASKRALE